MPIAGYAALVFTVLLLVTTAYFLMGGLPLLILKHDVPLDARFVRSFFTWYYRLAFWTSLGACLSYALWGKYAFSAGAAAITAAMLLLRKHLLRALQDLAERIAGEDAGAIGQFKRVHATALSINLLQLVLVVWGVLRLSVELS